MEEKSRRYHVLTHVLLVINAFIWATNAIVGKIALARITPLMYQSLRLSIATPLLFITAWIFHQKAIIPQTRNDYFKLVLLGLTGVAMNGILYMSGLKLVPASTAGILQPIIVVPTLIMSVIIKREKLTILKVLGVISAVIGAVIVLKIDTLSISFKIALGALLIILSYVVYGFYLIYQKPLIEVLPPMAVVSWSILFGSIPTYLFLFVNYQMFYDMKDLQTKGWLSVLFGAIFSMYIAYSVTVIAIKRTTATVVAAYGTALPFLVAIESNIVLGEQIGYHEVIGGFFTITGLVLIIYGRVRENKQIQLESQVEKIQAENDQVENPEMEMKEIEKNEMEESKEPLLTQTSSI